MKKEKELSKVGQGFNDARGEIPDMKDIPRNNGQNLNNDPAHHRANEKDEAVLPGGKRMKITKSLAVFLVCSMLLIQVQAAPVSVPLYKVTVVQNSARAINYRYLKSSTMIDFKGTVLLSSAKGEAEVKSKGGATEIDATFENLTPASQFGPEYLTYVLWSISPEGRATNLGELIATDGKSELKVTSPLQAFGLIVTAEPYFAISQPSNVVVLENAIRKNTSGKIELIDAKYELLQRGQYTTNVTPGDLQAAVVDPKTPPELYQARNALRIAKASGADVYAADSYKKAEQSLQEAEAFQADRHWYSTKRIPVSESSRQSIQSSEDARLIAIKRQDAESLATERQVSKDQLGMANNAATTAALGQAQAENAKDQANAARTVAEAASATSATAADQANAGRVAAEAAAATSEQARHQAANERNIAVGQAQRAQGEQALLRTQLLQQFNTILQTRESARGLIVNMSGVLFETGKSDLRPLAREKLAKISGIVLAHPGLKLEVEGHTDSVGGDALNQTLSEKRAEGARDYLVSQGVSANSIVSRGFGSTKPVASNDTAEGRQSNRRVELIVSGDAIQIPVKAENE
jgi:outer membrane protein OmpA-like peptidoglycan-associated protein